MGSRGANSGHPQGVPLQAPVRHSGLDPEPMSLCKPWIPAFETVDFLDFERNRVLEEAEGRLERRGFIDSVPLEPFETASRVPEERRMAPRLEGPARLLRASGSLRSGYSDIGKGLTSCAMLGRLCGRHKWYR